MLDKTVKNKWEKIGKSRRAGVLVPLFSIYSRKSLGIGDFEDLRLFIDWANKTGNSIVQLLPMNEMGPIFCPYDSESSFALEPLYICLRELTGVKKQAVQNKIENIKKTFPAGVPYVNFSLKIEKIGLLWDIFLEEDKDSKGFQRFKEENAYWLYDFALFKALKDSHQGYPWYEWDDLYKNRNNQELEAFGREHANEVTFQMWMQWIAFKQFKSVKDYAESKEVFLKGDLPILVSRDSADVWQHPQFFKLEFASGAPPDMYCSKGQRWGMPTYNWENIAADGYKYLKAKLRYAEKFYDILRIDHVVGLFRIWSIPYNEPLENQGLNGAFDPKDEKEWEGHGRKILSVILQSTKMLICAEDLGVVPEVCTKALKEFAIPGNDVQRWVKDWKTKHDFLHPEEYRYFSVAMLSTHDTPNWPAWWENEAGTIDEGLFIRKSADRKIDYNYVKEKLFDLPKSRHGRLRWLNGIDCPDTLLKILGKKKEEVKDFIDLYENSYREKEKLWKHLKIKKEMRENSDAEIVAAILKNNLKSRAIFCIETLIDWLYLTDIFKGDSYQFRTNTPGTTNDKNWSLVIPIALEDALKHKVTNDIRAMIDSSGRNTFK